MSSTAERDATLAAKTPDRPIQQKQQQQQQQHFFATPDDTDRIRSSSSSNVNNNNDSLLSIVQKSPVPLSREEADNEEVRKLAAKLTPALVEADAFLASHGLDDDDDDNDNDFRGKHLGFDQDEDDGIQKEVQDLQASEALLRQELEMAQDFSDFFRLSPGGEAVTPDKKKIDNNNNNMGLEIEAPSEPLRAEADMDHDTPELQKPPQAGLPPIPLPSSTSHKPRSNSRDSPASSTVSTPGSGTAAYFWTSPSGLRYSPADHMESLHLQQEEGAGAWYYSVNLTSFLLSHVDDHVQDVVQEYCLAVPEAKLKRQYVGLLDHHHPTEPLEPVSSPSSLTLSHKSDMSAAKLPVRTMSIRIRPDVLCGAVMEAVHHALAPQIPLDGSNNSSDLDHHHHQQHSLFATIRKRQGGHIRAWIPGAVVARVGEGEEFWNTSAEQHWAVTAAAIQESSVSKGEEESTQEPIRYPPFAADLQLVTLKKAKGNTCERQLVIRIYHPSVDDTLTTSSNDSDHDEQIVGSPASTTSRQQRSEQQQEDRTLAEPVPVEPSLSLRECASLIQCMEAPEHVRRKMLRSFHNNTVRNIPAMREAVREQLLSQYRACPSVKEGGITLPALNSEDFGVIQSSWRLVQSLWDELDTRGLAYSTLRESRFGTFPALPTLDVHYCSQIRRLSREYMVVQLLKSASQLEEYAREAEYACANMISLLKPSFEAYGIEEPALPKPVPLTAYPLDFTAPQASCPPWGMKVQHALDEIQAWTAKQNMVTTATVVLEDEEAKQSFELAEKAVRCVLEAFQKQDDEEQSARLGRKNVQVMDRLAKMQAHQQKSIEKLDRALEHSEKAAKAADDFKARSGVREVPLVKWKIVVGGSTGTCSVTAHHIMFVTQLIPVIGGSKVTVFPLEEVDFQLRQETPSLLNPLPTVIAVRKAGQEVFSFRPSMGGSRLNMFLALLKKTVLDNPLFVPT